MADDPASVPVDDDDSSMRWVRAAASAAHARTDAPTIVLDVGDVLSVCGWFVITSASNVRLVRTIAEDVEQRVVAEGGRKPLRVEGLDTARWVLLDYGDFVVHVFLQEEREYYDLERLWRDVPVVDWQTGS
jgi:ribosome-associated protein